MRLASCALAAALAVGLGACVVRDPAVNYGYAYPPGGQPGFLADPGSVGTPTPYEVRSQAPGPLDERATRPPGAGYAWIGGHWHWNGYDWAWVAGRWERPRAGYIYVPPRYDYRGPRFIYTPGYWSSRGVRSIGRAHGPVYVKKTP